MGLGDVLGGAGGIIGGIIGRDQASGDLGQSRDAMMMSSQILQQIKDAPDISKPLILEQYKQAGVLTPEMEQYITAQEPKAITTDPALKSAQMQALSQMQQRATGGLTAADRAALQQARLGAQGDTQSRLASIQQQAAMRGQAGGGTQLAAELAAAQGGANTEASQADQLAQMAQQAREQAVGQLGTYGSQLQAQDFGQQFQQQQAQQQMERFNIQNQLAQQQRNVATQNQAQAGNLANQQAIQNANTSQANQEQYNQLQRQMAQYNADVSAAKTRAGGFGQEGAYLGQQGAQTAQNAANMGAGIGNILGQGVQAFSGMPSLGGSPVSGTGNGAAKNGTYDDRTVNAYDVGSLWTGGKVQNYKQGGMVPGQAQLPGDHPQNDTVRANLSPGEIVIPRSLAESKIGKEILKLVHAHNSVKNKMNGND